MFLVGSHCTIQNIWVAMQTQMGKERCLNKNTKGKMIFERTRNLTKWREMRPSNIQNTESQRQTSTADWVADTESGLEHLVKDLLMNYTRPLLGVCIEWCAGLRREFNKFLPIRSRGKEQALDPKTTRKLVDRQYDYKVLLWNPKNKMDFGRSKYMRKCACACVHTHTLMMNETATNSMDRTHIYVTAHTYACTGAMCMIQTTMSCCTHARTQALTYTRRLLRIQQQKKPRHTYTYLCNNVSNYSLHYSTRVFTSSVLNANMLNTPTHLQLTPLSILHSFIGPSVR